MLIQTIIIMIIALIITIY